MAVLCSSFIRSGGGHCDLVFAVDRTAVNTLILSCSGPAGNIAIKGLQLMSGRGGDDDVKSSNRLL